MVDDLIYDVGMYDGADSAYYLRRGFRVIAVEADPWLCEAGRARFRAELASGQITIVPKAIVSDSGPSGTIELFVNRQNREWNSLVESNAARRDDACERVSVPAVRFESLLREFGVPMYLKADIEGLDTLCAEAINPNDKPRLASFEFSDDGLLDLLITKGYTRFKCIRQTDLCGLNAGMRPPIEPTTKLARWLGQRPERIRHKLVRVFRGKEAARAKKVFSLPDGSRWLFTGSSSGPFGDEADGPWLSPERLREYWKPWAEARLQAGENWRHWFDLHASW